MIDRTHPLPLTRQAEALAISRGSVYYQPRAVSNADLALMKRIDRLHLDYPFAGARMLRDLLNLRGIQVGRRRVRTLMRRMGIEALYRKPNTSKKHPAHRIYPYLLRQMKIESPNQVWAIGISRISRWPEALSIWRRWLTGTPVGYCPGGSRSPWMCSSVWIPFRRLSTSMVPRRSSIPIRAANSPVWPLPTCSRRTVSVSAWTARAAGGIMSSLNGCGERSSTKRFISRPMNPSLRPEPRSGIT